MQFRRKNRNHVLIGREHIVFVEPSGEGSMIVLSTGDRIEVEENLENVFRALMGLKPTNATENEPNEE
jgi:hypothetical protein